MAFLEVTNITKRFGKVNVLRGVDLSLEKGQVLSIILQLPAGQTEAKTAHPSAQQIQRQQMPQFMQDSCHPKQQKPAFVGRQQKNRRCHEKG